jgi:hypothetical protein
MLTADGEEGAEVYAGATVKDQAKILYRDAVNMVDLSRISRRSSRSTATRRSTTW